MYDTIQEMKGVFGEMYKTNLPGKITGKMFQQKSYLYKLEAPDYFIKDIKFYDNVTVVFWKDEHKSIIRTFNNEQFDMEKVIGRAFIYLYNHIEDIKIKDDVTTVKWFNGNETSVKIQECDSDKKFDLEKAIEMAFLKQNVFGSKSINNFITKLETQRKEYHELKAKKSKNTESSEKKEG